MLLKLKVLLLLSLAVNLCVCVTYNYNNPNTISCTGPCSVTVNVAPVGSLSSLTEVGLALAADSGSSASFFGITDFDITSPTGTVATMVTAETGACQYITGPGPGNIFSPPGLEVTFTDSATATISDYCINQSDVNLEQTDYDNYFAGAGVLPEQLLSTFDGENMAGTWTFSGTPSYVPTNANAVFTVGITTGFTFTASAGGDPHFQGFNEENYFFEGEEFYHYSLISDETVQVNMRTKSIDKHMATHTETRHYMSEIGFINENNHQILINTDSQPYVTIDNLSYSYDQLNNTNNFVGQGIVVNFYDVGQGEIHMNSITYLDRHQWSYQVPNCHKVVHISTDYFSIYALITNLNQRVGNIPHGMDQWIINLVSNVHYRSDDIYLPEPHGLLGQTFNRLNRESGAARSINDQFSIEGSIDDYKVSTIFASDDIYNKFN